MEKTLSEVVKEALNGIRNALKINRRITIVVRDSEVRDGLMRNMYAQEIARVNIEILSNVSDRKLIGSEPVVFPAETIKSMQEREVIEMEGKQIADKLNSKWLQVKNEAFNEGGLEGGPIGFDASLGGAGSKKPRGTK